MKTRVKSEDGIELSTICRQLKLESTDEWQKRDAEEQRDYEILTAEISKATFGGTPSQYKKLKGLKRENLGESIVSKDNYLPENRKIKSLKKS